MGSEVIADLTSEPTNILLLSPSFNSHSEAFCSDVVSTQDADRTALLVTNRESADECVGRWTSRAGTPPAELGIIAMGESTRSAAATDVQASGAADLTIETVAHPGDLTGVGIQISEQLERWHGVDRQIAACYDSLTVLLQYVSVEKAYQFLHVLTHQMKAAGVVAHYHLDPSAHDDETVYTLLPLFDVVIEFGDEGIESVRTR